ncbi:MAG: hypothetical protein IPH57_11150 [Saprospiraceae bacterium]|nr:hypothetical protein [Saprospiraceae bacterium]
MKYLLFVLIFITVSSCCLVTSVDCNCDPPKPFINDLTKEWLLPDISHGLVFYNKADTNKKILINRNFKESTEFVGGDECGSDFPVFITEFVINLGSADNNLISTKAVMNFVEFYISNRNFFLPIAQLDVEKDVFWISNDLTYKYSDTIINGSDTKKVVFKKQSNTLNNVFFNEITFVKNIGLTEFIDNNGEKWKLKE